MYCIGPTAISMAPYNNIRKAQNVATQLI